MAASKALVYLDDLSAGQRFATGSVAVGEAEIEDFAALYDPQPFHLDAEAARATFFQGLAASGWHVAALTMRLLVTYGPPLAWGYIGAGADIVWPAPTRPGDILHVEGELTAVTPSRSRPDRGMITLRSETLNQARVAVQRMTSIVVVPRRPA